MGLTRIKQIFDHVQKLLSKERCYGNMIRHKHTTKDGKCRGMTGGDRTTDFVSHRCIECPYYGK